jgi:hypothetical protein
MKNSLVTFPVVEKQVCNNCQITLGMDKLLRNVVEMTEDAYGIPAIMVRCPVCKTLLEWETKCN